MKYIKQFLIILTISFIGEGIRFLIPLPIPASIYGLILLFSLLCSGIVQPTDIKETALFLIEIMPILFIPASAGLIDIWELILPHLLPLLFITLLSTLIVMLSSGHITEYVIRQHRKSKER